MKSIKRQLNLAIFGLILGISISCGNNGTGRNGPTNQSQKTSISSFVNNSEVFEYVKDKEKAEKDLETIDKQAQMK